jgi:peptidoglycan hydrolase-like protein with peptidoglycan-binding domain
MGSRTRSAIEDFQARNGLQKTGLPDEAVFAAMRKKGLID